MEITFQYTYHSYNKNNRTCQTNCMNSFSTVLAKSNSVLIKELIFNSCFDNVASKSKLFFVQDFFGYYKEQKVHDIEKTVVNYKKCFALIRFFDLFELQIMFLGKPLLSELFFKNLSLKSRHIFLLNEDWLLGFLTNKRFFPRLIISFKSDVGHNEILNTPLVCFINSFERKYHPDYFFSFKSFSSTNFFFIFLRHLILNNNGKR